MWELKQTEASNQGTTRESHKHLHESRSILVSFESLVGICGLFSASALMHFPKEVNERLMNLASSIMWPSLPEIEEVI